MKDFLHKAFSPEERNRQAMWDYWSGVLSGKEEAVKGNEKQFGPDSNTARNARASRDDVRRARDAYKK